MPFFDRRQIARILQGLPAAKRRQAMQQLLGKIGNEVSRTLGGGRAAREVGKVVGGGGFHVGAELARYARGGGVSGFLRGLLGRLGPVGKVISWLFGKADKPKDLKPAVVGEAAKLLQDLGFEVRLPRDLQEDVGRGKGGSGGDRGVGGGTATDPQPAAADGQPPDGPATPAASSGGDSPSPRRHPGNLYVEMQQVHGSSNVYAFGYDAETLTLRVQFLGSTISRDALTGKGHRGKNRVRGKSGSTVLSTRRGPGPMYDYHGVPKRIFERMKSASSKGKFVWDALRIRGTMYGHQYDYDLVSASVADVVIPSFDANGRRLAGKKVGRVTYVPRKAAAKGVFVERTIRHSDRQFRSLLPTVGLPKPPRRDSRDKG